MHESVPSPSCDLRTTKGGTPDALLDRAIALERVDGDLELLREVVKLFLDETPALMRSLRTAIERGDCKAVERVAHSLKGSAANFGAAGVVNAARRLEELGRSGTTEGASELLQLLEAALEELRPALLDLINEGKRAASAAR
jgi:FOG: HPt domain